MKQILFFVLTLALLAASAHAAPETKAAKRIVSLDGAATETLFALGKGDLIVGRDMTSYYPAQAKAIPLVSQQHQVSAEGVISQKPDLVFIAEDTRSPELIGQLRNAKINVVTLPSAATAEAATAKINLIAKAVGEEAKGKELVAQMDRDLSQVEKRLEKAPLATRAAFLYMRGPQSVFLCGKGSKADGMFEIVKAENAAESIQGCKPMNAEALVNAKPQVIVLFDQGLESVGGVDGLLKIPGVRETPAGANRRIVAMDDLYLSAFGPRTGRAALDLYTGLYESKGLYVAK